jgi:hypothetical protein
MQDHIIRIKLALIIAAIITALESKGIRYFVMLFVGGLISSYVFQAVTNMRRSAK